MACRLLIVGPSFGQSGVLSARCIASTTTLFYADSSFKKLNVIQLVKEKVNHYIKLFANQQEGQDNNLP